MKIFLLTSLIFFSSVTPALATSPDLQFPQGFLWGASTAAHQVEGGNTNQWSVWEQQNADRLARTAPDRYKNLISWPSIKDQATDPANYISGAADDEYNRYDEDFDLLQQLSLNSYRFSLEWSRIEPKQGEFDEQAIEHYKEELTDLKKRGITPFVTIYHWTEPVWFSDLGGWEHSKSPEFFNQFVEKVAAELGDQVTYWATLNEPNGYAANSYLVGKWPPNAHNPFAYLLVTSSLIKAHKLAYTTLKQQNPKAQVGIAQSMSDVEAVNNSWLNRLIKGVIDDNSNYYFLNQIEDYQDYIGVNYYRHIRADWALSKSTPAKVSDMGWELYPQGIYDVLIGVKKYNKPIYITESGLADASDTNRAWYIQQTLSSVHQAIGDGADVRGYFHWSLLDNFEWAEGFWPRFGLVAVDRSNNLKRTIRPSAFSYASIAKNNTLPQP